MKYVIVLFFLVLTLDCISQACELSKQESKNDAIKAISEIFFKRNPDAIDIYVDSEYKQHQPGLANGRVPFKNYLKSLFIAFPDYAGEIENIVVEDDLVSFHVKWTGTHKGEFNGIKPTGKKVFRRTADIVRMKNGMIVEHWGVVDQLQMLKDLGAVL